jgi:tRNA(fMet)-specific endonuclease VapC
VRRFLLDTGIASAYIHRRGDVLDRAKAEVAKGNRVGICTPVLAELYYGVEFSATREKNLKRLQAVLPTWTVWPFTEAAASEFGRLAAELRRLGRPMGQIDIQIAAVALSLGACTVVSADSDLAAIPGLTVENWT